MTTMPRMTTIMTITRQRSEGTPGQAACLLSLNLLGASTTAGCRIRCTHLAAGPRSRNGVREPLVQAAGLVNPQKRYATGASRTTETLSPRWETRERGQAGSQRRHPQVGDVESVVDGLTSRTGPAVIGNPGPRCCIIARNATTETMVQYR